MLTSRPPIRLGITSTQTTNAIRYTALEMMVTAVSGVSMASSEGLYAGGQGADHQAPAVHQHEHHQLERQRDHHWRQHHHAHRHKNAGHHQVNYQKRYEDHEAQLKCCLQFTQNKGWQQQGKVQLTEVFRHLFVDQ